MCSGLDALQGVAFDNDKQITELVALRRDDPARPRVEVTVYGLGAAA